jgi:dTDP-4-dehydrorhamnose 3,5-epimerase-like enzyme
MFKFKNIHLDDETMWPTEARIPLEEPFIDDRGYIQHLVNFPMKNLSMIFSKKGSVRSNHSHNTDWHYMFTVSGSFDYHYKPHGSDEPLKLEKFGAGEMVFSPPMEDHACVFTEDTLLVAVSRNPRGDQETYENDVVRTMLVDPDSVKL